MARQGKIARLPHTVRGELNRRLLDGEKGPSLCAWLNGLAEVRKVLAAEFDGEPVSEKNLSAWRTGGYQEWLARNEHTENLKTLSEFALGAAKAGGNIPDGAAAIVGGHILEALETIALAAGGPSDNDAAADPADRLAKLAGAVASLQRGQAAKEKVGIAREKLKLDRDRLTETRESRKLAREKFERQSVEALVRYAQRPEVQKILGGNQPKAVQMKELHLALFGHGPKTAESNA